MTAPLHDIMTQAAYLLRSGNYTEGFKLFEHRFDIADMACDLTVISQLRRWQGEPVGHLVVLMEQGFGDCVQMARYLTPIARHVGLVHVIDNRRLADLHDLLALPANIVWRAVGERIEVPATAAWVPAMSLPPLFGADPLVPKGLWSNVYLSPPRGGLTHHIGLCLFGSPTNKADTRRSLTIDAARALYQRLLQWSVMSLHGADNLDRWQQVDPKATGASQSNWRELIQQIAACQVVISVDTAIAHLAGAMGRACLLLLCQDCDWRWGEQSATTPWYPSLRLYRQEEAGNWSHPVEKLLADLR